jgi:hypothetical protein
VPSSVHPRERNTSSIFFVRIFKASQNAFKIFGKRRGKIILRCQHLSDRCSDSVIAGADLTRRKAGIAAHTILNTVKLVPVTSPQPHEGNSAFRLRSAKTGRMAA